MYGVADVFGDGGADGFGDGSLPGRKNRAGSSAAANALSAALRCIRIASR